MSGMGALLFARVVVRVRGLVMWEWRVGCVYGVARSGWWFVHVGGVDFYWDGGALPRARKA